jgi:hypothetical protein
MTEEDRQARTAAVRHAVAGSREVKLRRIKLGLVLVAVMGVTAAIAGAVGLWVGQQEQLAAGEKLSDRVVSQCEAGRVVDPESCRRAADVQEKASAGPRGLPGIPGAAGRDGEDGRDGRDGKRGPRGVPGSPGPDGADGAPGADGADGADSVVPGPPGATGPAGPIGPEGPQGVRGESAWPFRFTFTVPTFNPAEPQRTYNVVCRTPGEPCEVTVQQSEPGAG